mmetsp:Transcript_13979/g.40227  ORF Transcript_13979/g.40227 Transcript_13979/m.40227 type:complete len:255 (+) Transcript_13979:1268-2032(+)
MALRYASMKASFRSMSLSQHMYIAKAKSWTAWVTHAYSKSISKSPSSVSSMFPACRSAWMVTMRFPASESGAKKFVSHHTRRHSSVSSSMSSPRLLHHQTCEPIGTWRNSGVRSCKRFRKPSYHSVGRRCTRATNSATSAIREASSSGWPEPSHGSMYQSPPSASRAGAKPCWAKSLAAAAVRCWQISSGPSLSHRCSATTGGTAFCAETLCVYCAPSPDTSSTTMEKRSTATQPGSTDATKFPKEWSSSSDPL